MDRGYPRLIYRDFPGIGYRVQAAFENRGTVFVHLMLVALQCQHLPVLVRTDDNILFAFSGYLYFSNGSTQKEYSYARRRVLRTVLNKSWMDCDE